MARWKLCRQTYGTDEFTIVEGQELTLGRAIGNNIVLSSIVISRNHCVIKAERDQILITDLKSSNGIYVGLKKIPPSVPYALTELDLVGIGWTRGAPVEDIKDNEKYMFKLVRELPSLPVTGNRIQFQSDSEVDEIEARIAAIDGAKTTQPVKDKKETQSPVLQTKAPLKRKIEEPVVLKPKLKTENLIIKTEPVVIRRKSRIVTIDDDIINISDSDNENQLNHLHKRPRLDPVYEELPETDFKEEPIKIEKEDMEYNAFHVKQEYIDDDPICLDSESDDDNESMQWRMRLSQNSPGKPFTKVKENRADHKIDESTYSQMEDYDDEDELLHDLISIPPLPDEVDKPKEAEMLNEKSMPVIGDKPKETEMLNEKSMPVINREQEEDNEEFLDDLISLNTTFNNVPERQVETVNEPSRDVVDAINKDVPVLKDTTAAIMDILKDKEKTAKMIEPLLHSPRKKPNNSTNTVTASKHKKSSSKHKDKGHSSSKRHITNSQKEERRKKLKDIATKEKEHKSKKDSNEKKDKSVSNVKLTNTNRGAFLSDTVQIVKPMKRKESPQKSYKPKEKTSPKTTSKPKDSEPSNDIENKKKSEKLKTAEHTSSKRKDKHESSKSKSTESKHSQKSHSSEARVPLKSLKPLSESEESFSGKPFSKVEPLPPLKKTVRFSKDPPKVYVFEIEEGNRMKSTSLVKASLENIIRATPLFSLEKMTLMRILKWNTHWLEEQLKSNEPPPILGHNNPAMTIFHSFTNHKQYVQLVGDLLLMEIWECLTQGYIKIRNHNNIGIKMTIGTMPPIPMQERFFELFNFSVDMSVPTSEAKNVPRIGEVLLMSFGPDFSSQRFFFVHNVRCLPSPRNNIHSFYSISLHSCYTDKMKTLKPGDTMKAVSLAYIQKELLLFQAMEYLTGSPLSDAILRPELRHFLRPEVNEPICAQSRWIKTLNPSQHEAVQSSVAAALSDRPTIQMVQGPPGTGKSSVITAIVMSYFYGSQMKILQNRGKVLICATSNAAVDELVIRLLNIRQTLPKSERFKMVRVGRAEAMHPRALDISSQQLALRDAAARHHAEPAPGLGEEISRIEAKINMWKTQEADAKEPQRAAYCRGRVNALLQRLTVLRSGGGAEGGALRPEQLAQAERRIVEGAHIVVTTLASAYNHKMRGLKRRIALCIVDEAGQAIEPETLIPLTLDVAHLTLIGDPQQLPGYICSQRAKKHGLGESLFARLTSSADGWEKNPVVLLNQQYRMHPEIAEYPNKAFYGGLVESVVQPRPELSLLPYCIVGISSGDKGQVASGANEMEAWGVARLVVALSALLRPLSLSLAVITPYNAHKDIIKRNLRLLQDPPESHIEVNTVDSFQGQERDVVVVSLARSQGLGFLSDTGRMNVMLTRAKHALLVCLNPHAIIKNLQWRTLVEDAQRRNLYRVLPNKMCQASPIQNGSEDILKYITNGKK